MSYHVSLFYKFFIKGADECHSSTDKIDLICVLSNNNSNTNSLGNKLSVPFVIQGYQRNRNFEKTYLKITLETKNKKKDFLLKI